VGELPLNIRKRTYDWAEGRVSLLYDPIFLPFWLMAPQGPSQIRMKIIVIKRQGSYVFRKVNAKLSRIFMILVII